MPDGAIWVPVVWLFCLMVVCITATRVWRVP